MSQIICVFFMLCFSVIMHASNDFEYLLTDSSLNPYRSSLEDLEEFVEKQRLNVEAALLESIRQELELEQERLKIESFGYSGINLLGKVNKHAEALKSGEVQLWSARDYEVRAFVDNSRNYGYAYFQKLDNFIQNYLDVAMAVGVLWSYEEVLRQKRISNSYVKTIMKFSKLQKLKNKYLANKHEYQQPKDFLRTTPYNNYFNHLKSFLSNTKSISEKIKRLMLKVKTFIKVVPSALRLLKVVFQVQQPVDGKSEIAKIVTEVFNKIGKETGERVVISGAENIPQPAKGNQVNIFVASHRHGLYDQVAISALNRHSMVYFGAPNNFIHNVFNAFKIKRTAIDKLNSNLGFVVVGRGRQPEPIDKAIKILLESEMREFLIFPGGRLPEGLGATMGVREKTFSEEGLTVAFDLLGYEVNLIPLSMPSNARLFDNKSLLAEGLTSDLKLEVYPAIKPQTRNMIIEYGGEDALGLLLRFGLTESLDNEKLLWGQVRAKQLKSTLRRFINPKTYSINICSNYFM